MISVFLDPLFEAFLMKDMIARQLSAFYHFPEAHHAGVVLLSLHFFWVDFGQILHSFSEFFHLAEAFDELDDLNKKLD
jgi:hypothetical protein